MGFDLVIVVIGYVMIWIATDIGRKEDSKVKIFSWKWVIMLVLISLGVWLTSFDNDIKSVTIPNLIEWFE